MAVAKQTQRHNATLNCLTNVGSELLFLARHVVGERLAWNNSIPAPTRPELAEGVHTRGVDVKTCSCSPAEARKLSPHCRIERGGMISL